MKLNLKWEDDRPIGGQFNEVEALFIVNNEDGSNHSILGVFDSPEKALKAIKEQSKIIESIGQRVPAMTMKVVVLNGGGYQGFRTRISPDTDLNEGYYHCLSVEALEKNPNVRMSAERLIKNNN